MCKKKSNKWDTTTIRIKENVSTISKPLFFLASFVQFTFLFSIPNYRSDQQARITHNFEEKSLKGFI